MFQKLLLNVVVLSTILLLNQSCSAIKAHKEEVKACQYYNDGDYENALSCYQKVDALLPNFCDSGISNCYLRMQKPEQAWLYVRKATILYNKDPQIVKTFISVWKHLKSKYNISVGMKIEHLIEILGQPDAELAINDTIDSTDECLCYGPVSIIYNTQTRLITKFSWNQFTYTANLRDGYPILFRGVCETDPEFQGSI